MRGLALLLVLGCSESKTADTGSATDGSLAESESDSNGNPDAWVWHPANAVGPHAAGTAESEMVGRTGETLKVQVWYPTDENSSMLHQYDGFMVYGALDTPDPLCDRTRPVVVFSHGNQGMRWQSAFIAERLASHGFLVVAPDHTGNTTFDYSRDRMPEMVFRRPFDVIDSADWLFGAGGVELGLTDCVDESDGYAVSGHSFGGYTATAVGGARFDFEASVAFCDAAGGWLCDEFQAHVAENPDAATVDFSDDRVWASIPLAPAGFEVLGAGAQDAEIPFLVLGAELDSMTTMVNQVEPIYEALGSQTKVLGTLLGSGHMIFSHACDLADFAECNDPYLSFEEGSPSINTAITAFLQMQLGHGDAEAFMPYDSPLWEWTQQ
jgi:predicted dienelactone hydrolase